VIPGVNQQIPIPGDSTYIKTISGYRSNYTQTYVLQVLLSSMMSWSPIHSDSFAIRVLT
jgi:hypothetical protein